MCSSIIHIVFNIVLIAALGFLLGALFTPSWSKIQNSQNNQTLQDRGLVIQKCVQSEGNAEKCFHDVWKNLHKYEQFTVVLLVLCILTAMVTIVWSCFLTCACCCKSCLVCTLPILCLAAALLDLAAIVAYTTKTNSLTPDDIYANMVTAFKSAEKDFSKGIPQPKYIQNTYGYSVWLAAVGGVGLLGDFVLGILLTCASKSSPI